MSTPSGEPTQDTQHAVTATAEEHGAHVVVGDELVKTIETGTILTGK